MSAPFDLTRRRIAFGMVLPTAIIIAVVLPLWLFHARLPEPLASWWNLRGEPIDSMEAWGMALFMAGLCAFPAFAMFRLAFLPHAVRGEISGPLGTAVFAGGSLVAISWMTTSTNLDVANWKQAGAPDIGLILLSIGLVASLGAVAARFSRALETASDATAPDLPSAGLAPGSRAIWVGTMRAPWARSTAIMILVFTLLGLLVSPGKIGPLHVFLVLMVLLFYSIRVTVDRNGVRIAYGLLGWPVQRVRLAQIRHASMLEVKALPFGGWVYRGSLKLLRRATIVVREGQGIRLELEGERTLDIAIDDAEQAAGVINDLVAANRSVAP